MSVHKFFLVKEESPYNRMIDFMFKDSNISEFTESKHSCVYSILTKRKVQKWLGVLINPLIRTRFGLYSFLLNNSLKDERQYIIFLNSSLINSRFPASVLNFYKRKFPNMVFVLLYIDIVSHPVSEHANLLREEKVFDIIYTVDKVDSERYSFKFTRTPYSYDKKYGEVQTIYHLYFCGVTKDRALTILRLIEQASSNNVDFVVDIKCNEAEKKDFSLKKNVNILEDYVSYDGLLSKTLCAGCILDLVQDGQCALTLRPYEAVVYNRKLLTNNRSIFEFEFYDPRYMQYFNRIEDIDWDWVKSKDLVDYKYNGDFSPIRLLEDIETRIKQI